VVSRTLHLIKTLAFLVTVQGHFTKGHKRTPAYILWDFWQISTKRDIRYFCYTNTRPTISGFPYFRFVLNHVFTCRPIYWCFRNENLQNAPIRFAMLIRPHALS